MLDVNTFQVPNGAGWHLYAKRVIDPEHFDPQLRPVAIVPGYGMNSFIFGFHPSGRSMEEYLAGAGFEVWSMNFRGQDHTVSENGSRFYGIGDIAKVDLPAIINFILQNTTGRRRKIDIIGCSLGATYVFAYAALNRPNPLANIVAMGGPLRWVDIHPVLRIAFSQPRLLRYLDLRHTRTLARCVLPIAARIPSLLHIYMHPEIVDVSHAADLAKTVENPNPVLNQEIAVWIADKDLVLDGVNISVAFKQITNPLFCIQANADGVVPESTAFSALDLASSKVKDSLIVGTEEIRMAHADMYISHYAQDFVFKPLAGWLLANRK